MNYRDGCIEFLNWFLTQEVMEEYHIKSAEKANVCYRGKGILAPFFEVYVNAILDKDQKDSLKELMEISYKRFYKTDILPGINILSSAKFVREYKGKYYHLRIAKDSPDRDFPDYELFEVPSEGYEAILMMKRASYDSEYDKKFVRRISSLEDVYKEFWANGLSEKLLEMVFVDLE